MRLYVLWRALCQPCHSKAAGGERGNEVRQGVGYVTGVTVVPARASGSENPFREIPTGLFQICKTDRLGEGGLGASPYVVACDPTYTSGLHDNWRGNGQIPAFSRTGRGETHITAQARACGNEGPEAPDPRKNVGRLDLYNSWAGEHNLPSRV